MYKFYVSQEVAYIKNMEGVVTMPDNINSNEKLPVIVFLHGAGERGAKGDNFESLLKTHGIPKYFCDNHPLATEKVITLTPSCPDDMIWDDLTFQLYEWINKTVETLPVDMKKISITGISMGGFGTWSMLTSYPDFFYKAAPICGGGKTFRARILKDKQIRIFHGLDDTSVEPEYSLLMYRAALKAGAKAELTTYSGVGHNCWEKAYEETDLIKWLCE